MTNNINFNYSDLFATINAGNIALNAASTPNPLPSIPSVTHDINDGMGSHNAGENLPSNITVIDIHSSTDIHSRSSSNPVNISTGAMDSPTPLQTHALSILSVSSQPSPEQSVTPVINTPVIKVVSAELQAQKKQQSRINKIALLIFGCIASGLMIAGGVMGSKPMILTAIAISIFAVASWALFKSRVSCSG